MKHEKKRVFAKGPGGDRPIVVLPTVVISCTREEDVLPGTDTGSGDGSCVLSPSETKGPFPIKTPADLVRASIVSDRVGIALLVTLTIQDRSNDCAPPGRRIRRYLAL